MPGVSFYLDQSALDTIKAKSRAEHKPVSKIVREAVERIFRMMRKRRLRSVS